MSIVLFGFGRCVPLEDSSRARSLSDELFTLLNTKPISSGFSWEQVQRI